MKRNRIPPAALREIWEQVPKMQECKGRCQNSCGPIDCSTMERKLIEDRIGKKLQPTPPTLACSALKNGRCTAYSIRPVVCRLWGVVESMPCPHGCKPERTLTDKEGFDLMRQAFALAGDEDESSMLREALELMSEPELEAFKRMISNSTDLGNDNDKRREATIDFITAIERRRRGLV